MSVQPPDPVETAACTKKTGNLLELQVIEGWHEKKKPTFINLDPIPNSLSSFINLDPSNFTQEGHLKSKFIMFVGGFLWFPVPP